MASMSSEEFEYSLEDMTLDAIEIPEIDSALLMELLEESQVMQAEDDQLQRMVHSLEAEISPGASGVATWDQGGEACGLEDILSDLDSHDFFRSSYLMDDDMSGLVNMKEATESPGCAMDGWYMEVCIDEAEMIGENYADFYYEECSEEQMYSSLWA